MKFVPHLHQDISYASSKFQGLKHPRKKVYHENFEMT
jgi:hypothetical protein